MKKRKVAAEEQGAQEPKPKRKRKTKVMSKKVRETLQDSIRAIDTSVPVSEVVRTILRCDDILLLRVLASPFRSMHARRKISINYR